MTPPPAARRRTGRTLLREVLLTGAAVAGVLCLLAALASFAFDIRPLIFRSGSMGPAIETGAFGLAREVPARSLRVGDVVSVPNARGVRVTHRVEAVEPGDLHVTLTLRGDANAGPDAEPYVVDHADRLFYSVNHLGYVIAWFGNRSVIFSGGVLVGVLAAYAFRRDAGIPRTRRTRGAPAPAALLTALVAGGLGVLLVPQATGTLAAFTDNGLANSGTFSTRFWRCDSAILSDAPRIYYKLNEIGTATAAADASGQNRPGIYQGTVTKGVASPCTRDGGTAVTFNGTNGYVNWNSTTALQVPVTYSTEVWFRTTTTAGGLLTGWGAAATGASATVDRVLYMTSAGRVAFGNNNGAKVSITSTLAYNDGAWHHALATVGTGGMRLYVDGAQVATVGTVASAAYSGYFRVGYDVLTGWTGAPTSNFFNGTLDEAVGYSTTLTLADAQEHYRAAT